MLSSCLFCQRALPANDVLERFGVGRRVAYDPARGRLWAVCPACARWNLAPIEERWEALEELEKLTYDRGRLLARTDNIELLSAGALDVVRVGRARLREEAWWRFGEQLRRRRGRGLALHLVDAGLALTLGVWGLHGLVRNRTFGRAAWEGLIACPRCDSAVDYLTFKTAGALALRFDAGRHLSLAVECEGCSVPGDERWILWTAGGAEDLLRRLLAFRNFDGAGDAAIAAATSLIDAAGSPAGFVVGVAREGRELWDYELPRLSTEALALEIALSDAIERRRLEAEAADLEAEWREAEPIAAIADRELTPLPRPPAP